MPAGTRVRARLYAQVCAHTRPEGHTQTTHTHTQTRARDHRSEAAPASAARRYSAPLRRGGTPPARPALSRPSPSPPHRPLCAPPQIPTWGRSGPLIAVLSLRPVQEAARRPTLPPPIKCQIGVGVGWGGRLKGGIRGCRGGRVGPKGGLGALRGGGAMGGGSYGGFGCSEGDVGGGWGIPRLRGGVGGSEGDVGVLRGMWGGGVGRLWGVPRPWGGLGALRGDPRSVRRWEPGGRGQCCAHSDWLRRPFPPGLASCVPRTAAARAPIG